ncbi:MAG TPA: hypothetical protein VJ874_06940, partial [Candidatus Thermoplasmatota archaeon]|nr:hypothetical protein [Candidatus Thermoplasmatota archaeon]
LRFFDHAGLAESVKMCVYLGHTDLQTRDHPLVADVDWNARVTGEGPAIGFAIPQEYPQWGLVPGSVAALGGELVGTTGEADLGIGGGEGEQVARMHGDHVHGPTVAAAEAAPNTEACQSDHEGVVESLGRVPLGQGSIDFLGGALPRPTQAYDHRYGLADYSVSALTYWIVMNSLGGHIEYQPIDEPFVPTYDFDPLYGAKAQAGGGPDGGKDSPGLAPLALLVAVAAAVLLSRRR